MTPELKIAVDTIKYLHKKLAEAREKQLTLIKEYQELKDENKKLLVFVQSIADGFNLNLPKVAQTILDAQC